MLTVIFALYIAGLLGTLLVAGQLSDHDGRKPVLLPGLLAALVACGLFASANSIGMLAIGRLLAGVAVGVIVSAGMATSWQCRSRSDDGCRASPHAPRPPL